MAIRTSPTAELTCRFFIFPSVFPARFLFLLQPFDGPLFASKHPPVSDGYPFALLIRKKKSASYV